MKKVAAAETVGVIGKIAKKRGTDLEKVALIAEVLRL